MHLCPICAKMPNPKYISLQEYLKHALNPAYKAECGTEVRDNAVQLLSLVNNLLMELISKGLITEIPKITSGWRPAAYNKQIGGSKNSKHIKGLAVDLLDVDRSLGQALVLHQEMLQSRGLAIEALSATLRPTPWVHIQLGLPPSGNVVFLP